MSSNLFNAALEMGIEELNWSNYGININGGKLTNLRYTEKISAVTSIFRV